ncbi:MAG: sigma-54 dependent transcriptional regulator [Vicinamibacterales bacterium]
MIEEQTGSDVRPRRPHVRGRERRSGLGDVLARLARVVGQRGDLGLLRGAFEESVTRTVAVRGVRLRDVTSRWTRASERVGMESIALDVSGWSPRTSGVLEATFDPGCGPSEWDVQMLKAASHLAVLVLELERGRAVPTKTEVATVPVRAADGAAPLIGSTVAMAALRTRIERVAATDFTVLLEGESGVGKELVARQIHELSGRRAGPFVAINCAALVETLLEAELFGIEDRTATGVRGRRGKFEHADGGTLFLDEVSDLSMSAQAKLLRAIQELAVERVGATGVKRVDIRIIAATNRGLAEMVERQLFRADLFYRLSGVDIRVPALRERRSDILELARYFLARHRETRRLGLSDTAELALTSYHWPGNVRELERMMERAVALAVGDVIELDDLPARVRGDYAEVLVPSLGPRETLRLWAGRYVRLILNRCEGNKRRASRTLGISYHTLNGYLQEVSESEEHSSDVAAGADAGRESGPAGLPASAGS